MSRIEELCKGFAAFYGVPLFRQSDEVEDAKAAAAFAAAVFDRADAPIRLTSGRGKDVVVPAGTAVHVEVKIDAV